MSINVVLVPTDFSDAARNALRYAVRIFGTSPQYLLLNTYIEPATTASSMISLRELLREAAVTALATEKEQAEKEFPGIRLETLCEYGDADLTIVHASNNRKADIVVMGTTGKTGLEEMFMGSVSSSVTQTAQCPVIAVPAQFKSRLPKWVLFAADLKDYRLPEAFYDVMEIAASHVTIMTVSDDDDKPTLTQAETGYDLHLQLKDIEHKFEVVDSDNVEGAIAHYAHKHNMDMVVCVPRKAPWYKRLLHASVSKKLTQHLDIPLFVLP